MEALQKLTLTLSQLKLLANNKRYFERVVKYVEDNPKFNQQILTEKVNWLLSRPTLLEVDAAQSKYMTLCKVKFTHDLRNDLEFRITETLADNGVMEGSVMPNPDRISEILTDVLRKWLNDWERSGSFKVNPDHLSVKVNAVQDSIDVEFSEPLHNVLKGEFDYAAPLYGSPMQLASAHNDLLVIDLLEWL